MQDHSSGNAVSQARKRGGSAPLKIVIVYDGIADLVRGYEMWQKLAGRFIHEIQIHSRAWNFSLLSDPRIREQATRQTAEADLVVLSTSGNSALPRHMQTWISSWLPHKAGRGDALVAVLDLQSAVDGAASALRNYLWEAAKQGGMDFFCNTDHPPLNLATE